LSEILTVAFGQRRGVAASSLIRKARPSAGMKAAPPPGPPDAAPDTTGCGRILEAAMRLMKLLASMPVALAATPALAGITPVPLGRALGFVLGTPVVLGQALPVVGSGVLLVAGAGLALGIYIVRRKQKR
jgi:hypothetical protein